MHVPAPPARTFWKEARQTYRRLVELMLNGQQGQAEELFYSLGGTEAQWGEYNRYLDANWAAGYAESWMIGILEHLRGRAYKLPGPSVKG
jgi:hypothetical protein